MPFVIFEVFSVLQVNPLRARPISTNSISQFYQSTVGIDKYHELSFKTKAKLSVEADVVEKEANQVNEKIGNSSSTALYWITVLFLSCFGLNDRGKQVPILALLKQILEMIG